MAKESNNTTKRGTRRDFGSSLFFFFFFLLILFSLYLGKALREEEEVKRTTAKETKLKGKTP